MIYIAGGLICDAPPEIFFLIAILIATFSYIEISTLYPNDGLPKPPIIYVSVCTELLPIGRPVLRLAVYC